jgi:hypothetical protein
MKYDHFSMLPERAFQPRNGRTGMTLEGGGGGGPSHTTSTVNQSSIPDWLRPQTEAVLGAGMQEYFDTTSRKVTDPITGQTTTEYDITGTKPYTPYSTDPSKYFAGFTPGQEQVFSETANLQTPGAFGAAGQLMGAGGRGGLESVVPAYGYGQQAQQSGLYGQGIGFSYGQMATDPRAVQAYMSPYQQGVTDIAKAQAIEDAKKSQLGANLGAVRQGTYGGARQSLVQAQREAALQKQLGDIQTQGLQSAYDRAVQAQQFGVSSGIQGAQAGIQGAQAGLQGVGAAQAGYGMAGQMGQGLTGLGQARQGADLARLGFQGQMGDVQQQRQQDIINQQVQNFALAQEMPMQRLAGYNALLRGYATPTSTVSQYQAQPSGLQQLAGLGTAAAGIGTIAGVGKKEGGAIKLAGGGGITDKDALESFAERSSIPQLQQSMQSGSLPKYIGMPILENEVAKAERMKMDQMLMAQGQQQGRPSISDEIEAKADQLQGVEPVMAAGGGIVAFQAGGLSLSDVMRQATLQEQRDYQRTGVLSARLQNLMAGQTMPQKGSGKAGIEAVLAEAEAGRGPNVQRVPDDPTGRNKVLQGVEDYRRDMNKAMGITDIVPPPAAPAAAPPTAPPPPAEQKTDMATLLAEREAQQKAFIGEDPSIKKTRESLAKQGEDTLLNRMLRGSQMVVAGEQLYTRGDASGLEKVIAGEGKRAESAAEREAKLAELEGADYRRKADIYKEVAGEERKKAGTKEERAFQEKLLNRKLEVEEKLAKMRPESATAELIRLGRSKNPIDRQIYKDLTASKSGAMTRVDALNYLKTTRFDLFQPGKEKERDEAVRELMGGGSGGSFTGFSSRELG